MVLRHIVERPKVHTMNDSELKKLIEELRATAERLDCTLDVDLPPPASTEAIAAVAAAVGGPLPDSLVSFLRMHDGMRLFLTRKNRIADDLILFPLFYIYGTDLIARFKRSVPGMFDGTELSRSTLEKAVRCVPIASVSPDNNQEQIMFVRDVPQPNNEYAIIEAAFDERQMWLDALADDVGLIIMATSFEEFIRRAIGNVLSGHLGFRYWNLKAAWVKYDGSPDHLSEENF
jgi:hypothetical protein